MPANPYLLEEIPAWLLIYVDGKINDVNEFLENASAKPYVLFPLSDFGI